MGDDGLSGAPRFRRLGAYDLHCLRVETSARPVHVGVLAVLDAGAAPGMSGPAPGMSGELGLDGLRREIAGRQAGVPELRRVVHDPGPLAGRPLWVDDPAFDVDRHVEQVDLPALGDEAALLGLVDRLLARPLDRTRPLWRLWFVKGLPGGRAAVLMAVHHALADGLTAMRLARSLLEGPPGAAPTAVAESPAGPPGWWALVIDNLATTLRAGARLVRPSTWRLAATVLRASARTIARARRAPPTSLNGPVGAGRRTALLRLDLATVKRVARRHRAGANDVVLTLVAAGLRDLLQSRGEPVEHLRPRAGVAVALFSRGRREDAGNDIGTYVVALPVGGVTAAARLRMIAAERARAARSQVASSEPLLRAWLGRFGFVRRAMARQQFINLAETYVPGPPASIEVLGAPVADLVPIAPLSGNLGLQVVALSYARRLVVTVRADTNQFPDLDLLLDGMERAWDTLAILPEWSPEGSASA